jgi:hypothetical protein
MSKITTEDCKDFLIHHFMNKGVETNEKDWKRTSKYKQGDIWIRDFSHQALGVVSLGENNGSLEIVETKIQEEKTEVSYFKKFSKEEVSGAKKLLQKLIKIRSGDGEEDDEDDEEDSLCKSDNWKKFSHALPSQFTFYFPFDNPYEIYHNDLANVINGLDSPMFFNGDDSFNVMFNDKNTDDIDLYTSDCLRSSLGVLPPWTDFIDEYHLEATRHAPKDLTVKEFIHVLFDLGFEYKVGGEYDCLFKKEIKAYISQLKTDLTNTNPKPKV